MVDLQTLAKINNRCKVARSLSSDSPELFGGLPIVVFMGDFYQFPPVKGLPLWRQPRDKKEEEVQGKEIWNEGALFQKNDMVMVSLENMKTNRPKKKWDDKWDGPYPVLAVYRGAVVVDLPDHIRVNKSFHTSKVRLWVPEEIPGQAEINSTERRNVKGRVVERDDNGNVEEKWEFEKILDVHNEDPRGLTYEIKWRHHKDTTWQLEDELKGCERAVQRFHELNPRKPAPRLGTGLTRGTPAPPSPPPSL
jgi:hypothetical protein